MATRCTLIIFLLEIRQARCQATHFCKLRITAGNSACYFADINLSNLLTKYEPRNILNMHIIDLSTARPKWRIDGPALSGHLLYLLYFIPLLFSIAITQSDNWSVIL